MNVINDLANQSKLGIEEVEAAAARIASSIERTPLVESQVGGRTFWLKCECMQIGGSFKLRGASNRLLQLNAEERERGVVAFSSGNHARGVAIAAQRLGIRAIIVMPADAPAVKVEGTRAEGAEIVFYDRRTESREAIAAEIATRHGSIVVPSFDNPAIIAGQGTVGLEIREQLGRTPARVVVPCGGGGLSAGIALALPDAAITAVEPAGWGDMGDSLARGEIVPVAADAPPTACDALQTPRVSPITFGILQRGHAAAAEVTDAEAFEAMRFAWREHGLTVEPGGAVALAALLTGKVSTDEATVVIISGGNVDPALRERVIAGEC